MILTLSADESEVIFHALKNLRGKLNAAVKEHAANPTVLRAKKVAEVIIGRMENSGFGDPEIRFALQGLRHARRARTVQHPAD